eukprot:3005762-Ditylum_brightwellii.AAC.1
MGRRLDGVITRGIGQQIKVSHIVHQYSAGGARGLVSPCILNPVVTVMLQRWVEWGYPHVTVHEKSIGNGLEEQFTRAWGGALT